MDDLGPYRGPRSRIQPRQIGGIKAPMRGRRFTRTTRKTLLRFLTASKWPMHCHRPAPKSVWNVGSVRAVPASGAEMTRQNATSGNRNR
jgi:hypothetical protein